MSVWMLTCTSGVIKHMERSIRTEQDGSWQHHVCAVWVVAFLPCSIKHIANQMWFLPWSHGWAIHRYKYGLALLQFPQVNCVYKREKADFTAFEAMAEISKPVKLLQHSCFTDPERPCWTLKSSFCKRTQLTTWIQQSYSMKSKTFQQRVPDAKPPPLLTDKNQFPQNAVKQLVWFSFTPARALTARQYSLGLLLNMSIWIDSGTSDCDVLGTASLSLNFAEDEYVAQLNWVPALVQVSFQFKTLCLEVLWFYSSILQDFR